MTAGAWYERVATGSWRRVRRAAEAAGGTVGRAMISRRMLLFVVTAGAAMGEVAALNAYGYVSALGLAPQVSAPPPFGVFHDMRWLFVYNTSWGSFAGEAVALVIFRSLLNTAIIVLAWPADRPRPRLRSVLLGNVVFAAVALIILSPWACVAYAASGTSLSYFIFGEIIEFVILAIVLQRGGIISRWWLGLPSLRMIGLALATFGALTLGSLVINLAPGWWVLPVAGAAGGLNALLWEAVIAAAVSPDPLARMAEAGRIRAALARGLRWLRVPALAVPLALAVTAGGLVLIGNFLVAGGSSSGGGISAPLVSRNAHGPRAAVLYVDGYDSSFSGKDPIVVSPGLYYEVYSYRGLNSRGLPRSYTLIDTHQSLARSARLLATQVSALHKRTGRPVEIVAESEGTLVARTYLIRLPHPNVTALALFSPLIRPARVYYPPAGGGPGFGYVTGRELAGMLDLLHDSGSPPISTKEPFVRSIVDDAPLYRNLMLCPAPGVRSVAFLSLAAATVAPPGPLADIPVVEMPGIHASLEGRADVRRLLVPFLRGAPIHARTMVSYEVVRDASAGWLAPALPLSVNPAWNYPASAPDASFGGPICRAPVTAGGLSRGAGLEPSGIPQRCRQADLEPDALAGAARRGADPPVVGEAVHDRKSATTRAARRRHRLGRQAAVDRVGYRHAQCAAGQFDGHLEVGARVLHRVHREFGDHHRDGVAQVGGSVPHFLQNEPPRRPRRRGNRREATAGPHDVICSIWFRPVSSMIRRTMGCGLRTSTSRTSRVTDTSSAIPELSMNSRPAASNTIRSALPPTAASITDRTCSTLVRSSSPERRMTVVLFSSRTSTRTGAWSAGSVSSAISVQSVLRRLAARRR
jgi:hypothetical protein